MDVPKSFRPEKDLREKTEQLMDGPILKRPENIEVAEGSDLERILKDLAIAGNNPASLSHSRMDSLLEKTDYKELTRKNEDYKFWTRKSCYNPQETDVFIRKKYKGKYGFLSVRYDFASVKKNRLGDFCKNYEKYRTLDQFMLNASNDQRFIRKMTNISYVSLIAGIVSGGYILNHYWKDEPILSAVTGIVLGSFVGYGLFFAGLTAFAYSMNVWRDRAKKKMVDCCGEVIINHERDAIIRALGS